MCAFVAFRLKGACYSHAFLWCKPRQYKYHKIIISTERIEQWESDEGAAKRHCKNSIGRILKQHYFHSSLLFLMLIAHNICDFVNHRPTAKRTFYHCTSIKCTHPVENMIQSVSFSNRNVCALHTNFCSAYYNLMFVRIAFDEGDVGHFSLHFNHLPLEPCLSIFDNLLSTYRLSRSFVTYAK